MTFIWSSRRPSRAGPRLTETETYGRSNGRAEAAALTR
jgi:hypothetical protein